MPADDERNILHIGPPARPGAAAITQAMADAARQRIEAAGGSLTVWAVLHEDVYERGSATASTCTSALSR